MPYPAALQVSARPAPEPGAPTVVFVHGSLDRSESFRRVMRRLPELTTVTYDRRGYQGSRGAGVTDLGGHIEDLLAISEELRPLADAGGGPLVAVGHSFGGDVVVGAALASPRAFDAIGAFEPPMPWLGFRRPQAGACQAQDWPPMSEDPAVEVEHFFSRMVGPEAWTRLSDDARGDRIADGPALMGDLRSFRSMEPVFDVTALAVPAVFGRGGEGSAPHHQRSVEWLGENVPGASVFRIDGAQHGAHLSHPDHFAAMTRLVAEKAAGSS
jgi:pimeloyl-ACP methyl ester carboxylesterase